MGEVGASTFELMVMVWKIALFPGERWHTSTLAAGAAAAWGGAPRPSSNTTVPKTREHLLNMAFSPFYSRCSGVME
jgi:hypothetical protein